jgi:hypothetical protein
MNPLDLCIIVAAGAIFILDSRSRQCSPAERMAASKASRTPAPVIADASMYRMPSLCATPSPSARVTLRSPSHFVPTSTRAMPGRSRIACAALPEGSKASKVALLVTSITATMPSQERPMHIAAPGPLPQSQSASYIFA